MHHNDSGIGFAHFLWLAASLSASFFNRRVWGDTHYLFNQGGFAMIRFASMIILATFLTVAFGAPTSFANEPTPTEQKEKKDVSGGKADEGKKKDEKKDMGGK